MSERLGQRVEALHTPAAGCAAFYGADQVVYRSGSASQASLAYTGLNARP